MRFIEDSAAAGAVLLLVLAVHEWARIISATG